ncbi:MAG TPA: 50S ribosomal protein L1 [Patescibacteria group bacterium]|nr:50S ribosomal protein L1 [Patescibacteria group bacterium]
MRSKRYQGLKSQIETKRTYSIDEAIPLLKKTSQAGFDATVELHTHLGIDPSKGDQQVRGTVALPHGTGKTKRVAVFVEAEKEAEAKAAGADVVGGEELIAEISKTEKVDFDVAVTTPAMMPKLAKLAKILGPKGLMPNPKTETIGPNIVKMIQEQKAGKISFKNDDTGNIHQAFGKASFDESSLKENLMILLESIKKAKPAASKGIYIRNAVLCSAMGPAIRIEVPVV